MKCNPVLQPHPNLFQSGRGTIDPAPLPPILGSRQKSAKQGWGMRQDLQNWDAPVEIAIRFQLEQGLQIETYLPVGERFPKPGCKA